MSYIVIYIVGAVVTFIIGAGVAGSFIRATLLAAIWPIFYLYIIASVAGDELRSFKTRRRARRFEQQHKERR